MFTLGASLISLQKFSDAEELYCDQLPLFARSIRMKLQPYFKDTGSRFACITAIVSEQTDRGCGPLKDIFRLSDMVVENDKNNGFKLFSRPLDAYLRQALKDLLDDPQGEYFIDDSQYTDIALIMIDYYISAEIR